MSPEFLLFRVLLQGVIPEMFWKCSRFFSKKIRKKSGKLPEMFQKSIFNKLCITPLHRDPKQQELRTHLRPRLETGPSKR